MVNAPGGRPESARPGDLARFAFGEQGAWQVVPDRLSWLGHTPVLRSRARERVPRWIARRRLPPLRRFLEAVWRVGGALLAWQLRERRHGGRASRAALSRRLRIAFERLGPTYIKLGQILSSGRGLFPDELVEEFKRCRDRVPPEPFETVRRVVEAELGRPLEQVFAHFERDCLAAASIAQVHAARLHGGEEVVVKVQRPAVAERVARDVASMAWIAPFLVGRIPVAALANPPALVELFAETITEELDFRLEAENMLDVARVLREAGQEGIVVPRPHPELVRRRVLVQERLRGFQYDDVEGMREAGIDTTAVLRALLISLLEGALIYGVFHGDLHGGNLFVMEDGRVALFDYGITGRMDEGHRRAFLRMMMAGAVNDLRGQLAALRDLGALAPDADLEALARALRVDEPVVDPTRLSGEELVAETQAVIRSLLRHGARLPKPLMLYVKDMLFFDGAVAQLAPDLNVFGEILRIYAHFASRHGSAIQQQIGFDPGRNPLDLAGVRQSLGLEGEVEAITHREIQQRRETVWTRLTGGGEAGEAAGAEEEA